MIGIVSAATLAVGLTWLVRQTPRGSGDDRDSRSGALARGHDDRSRIEAMQRDVNALHLSVAQLDRQVAGASASKDASARAPEPSDEPEHKPPSREERRQAALERHRQQIAALDGHMRLEVEDKVLAVELHGELVRSVEGLPGSAVGSIECHASLCRAEMTHADPSTLQRFMEEFSQTGHRPFSLFHERDGERLKVTLFTARSGASMPDLANEARTVARASQR